MSRMAQAALALLLTVSAVLAQVHPGDGLGEVRDPGLGGGGDAVGGDLGAGLIHAGTDIFNSAARVSQFDGLPDDFFRPGMDPFRSSVSIEGVSVDLRLSPGLQEATESLLEAYGISGHMLQVTDAPLRRSPPPPSTQPYAPGDPAAGGLRIEPWWQGGLPAPIPGGGVPAAVVQNAGQPPAPDPGQPAMGDARQPLIDVPAPAPLTDDSNQRLVSGRGMEGPSVQQMQELIDLAAADVASNRIARAVDPNSRANRGASPEECRTRGRLGTLWLRVLEGEEVAGDDAQFLRDHLDAALTILDSARRNPRDGDDALQRSIDTSACAIVDSIQAAVTR